jgi:hypothetical protein
MRAARVILSVAVGALALSASTAGARPAPGAGYADGVKVAGKQVSDSLQSLVTAVGISLRFPVVPTAGRQCAAILTKTEGRLASAQRKLASLKPPASARQANAQLLAGTIALERQLRPLIVRLRNGYLVDAAKLLKLPAVRTIERASARLKSAGYPTGI